MRLEASVRPPNTLLDALATAKIGLLREIGTGEIFLTPTSIVWRRVRGPLDWLFFWLPRTFQINRREIKSVRLHEELTRSWISIDDGKKTYTLRIGLGPHPLLKDNPATTKRWYELLRSASTGTENGPSS